MAPLRDTVNPRSQRRPPGFCKHLRVGNPVHSPGRFILQELANGERPSTASLGPSFASTCRS